MPQLIIVVVVVVVAVIVAVAVRRGHDIEPQTTTAGTAGSPMDRLRPPLIDFHVKGEDALVNFDVPLPKGDTDEVLSELLVREAVEVLREKQLSGLPLDLVKRVRAFGVRNGDTVEAGSKELAEPGALPPSTGLDLVPHASATSYDPLSSLEPGADAAAPGLADRSDDEFLGSIGDELRLTKRVEAGLRSQGIDPAGLSVSQLVLGLLRLHGYAVQPSGDGGDHMATKAGKQTWVRVIEHTPGDYPELDEMAIRSFIVDFNAVKPDRGILVSAKLGPFSIYEKEKREPRMRFVTRERLQSFVDSLSVS